MRCMKEINKVTINAPVKIGDIVIKNVLETGVDVIATKNIS
jgi:CxxC motif-containing protein